MGIVLLTSASMSKERLRLDMASIVAAIRPEFDCRRDLQAGSYNPYLGGNLQQARLAQSVEHGTLNPRVVGSSPTSGALFLPINLGFFAFL